MFFLPHFNGESGKIQVTAGAGNFFPAYSVCLIVISYLYSLIGGTMRTKLVLLAATLTLVLVLTSCTGTSVGSTAPNRNLSVTGTGTVYLTPDIAYIYIGVHTEDENISQAVADNNAKAEAVASALSDFGVADRDIQTSNFSIWPNQQYDPMTGQISGTVYMVDNSVYVKVRDLDSLADLLEAAIDAGANSINSIQFDVADKSAGMTDARQLAVDNANALAAELASAANVQLGEIQTISYYDSQVYPYYGYGMGGGGGGEGGGGAPIAPGQLTLSVTVSITYDLD
jgi:uncharacterized protein YggE